MNRKKRNITIKTKEELVLMRKAGVIWKNAQDELKKVIVPGISLLELDKIAEDSIRTQGALPAFKGFAGFPNTLCTMINDEVVHGIPSNRKLEKGDLLTIDGGAIFKGWYSDAAFSLIVGGDEANPERAKFSKIVYNALQKACAVAKDGFFLGDIGYVIEKTITDAGYSVCKEYTGHGIGREMHEDPYVSNYGDPGTGMRLKEGMTMCIEPIIAMGSPKVKTLSDGWTVATVDGKDSCQWEHCGVVTKTGLEIFV